MFRFSFVFVCLVSMMGVFRRGNSAQATPNPPSDDIRRWLNDLTSPRFAVRKEAAKNLIRTKDAKRFLEPLLPSSDPDLAEEVRKILIEHRKIHSIPQLYSTRSEMTQYWAKPHRHRLPLCGERLVLPLRGFPLPQSGAFSRDTERSVGASVKPRSGKTRRSPQSGKR